MTAQTLTMQYAHVCPASLGAYSLPPDMAVDCSPFTAAEASNKVRCNSNS